MSKPVFYLILVVCMLLVPLRTVGFLGTLITDKYQVQHARTFVELDSGRMTLEERQSELAEIESLERSIMVQQLILFITGVSASLGTSYLLIKRKKLIKRGNSSN